MNLNNLEWLFYVKFSLLRTAFQQLGYIFTVVIGVGAQSTLGGYTVLPENICMKN